MTSAVKQSCKTKTQGGPVPFCRYCANIKLVPCPSCEEEAQKQAKSADGKASESPTERPPEQTPTSQR